MNFSAGPSTLPLEVLEEARDQLINYQDSGASLIEVSHRGKAYSAVHEEALANLHELLGLTDDHAVLLLQSGATGQFAMVPMNLLGAGQTADYTNSGSWAKKAIGAAQKIGDINVVADCGDDRPTRVPTDAEMTQTPGAAYLHITTNETISGAQWKQLPETDAPLVADMSSDILSRPLDYSRLDLVYAGAQKNLGPAGATLVAIRRDLAEQTGEHLPLSMRYKTHMDDGSMHNTPPCFSVYMIMLVTRWLKKRGLESVFECNRRKAEKLYAAIDATDFYQGTAATDCRSDMNVTFRLANEQLEPVFADEATKEGMIGLKGHRSVGGLRASIYNAFPEEGVDALVSLMQEFERTNG
jgi:phosphoserine aminotransferase